MTGRMSLALSLFLALLPQGAGASSPDPATIELRGSKSAHVDVRFDEPTKITCCTDPKSSDGKPSVPPLTVRTRGTYAGYVVDRLSDGKIVAGAIRVPVMDFADTDSTYRLPLLVLVKSSRHPLAPGSYRIHLVTDGPSTVRFRVDGLEEDAIYRPKSPTPVKSFFKTPTLGAGEPVSHHRTPVNVDKNTLVIVASLLVADQSQSSYLEHCVVQIVEPCQSRRDHSAQITISPVFNIWSLSRIYSVYRPGHFEPGEWQAQFSAASLGSVRVAQTFVLTLN